MSYGHRYRHGYPKLSGFVESAVNQVVSKLFVKKQQKAWSDRNVDDLHQVRAALLNDEFCECFVHWYPSIAVNDTTIFVIPLASA